MKRIEGMKDSFLFIVAKTASKDGGYGAR